MANGGIIGPNIVTSFGGCTVTVKTSSTPSAVTTSPGTGIRFKQMSCCRGRWRWMEEQVFLWRWWWSRIRLVLEV
jgi:hypothetical protein